MEWVKRSRSIWDCCPSCVDAWASFLLRMVDTFGFKVNLAAHQRVDKDITKKQKQNKK